MKQCTIISFHLFNDYSGSPKVLRMVLEGLLDKGNSVELITSKGGVLDELNAYPNIKRFSYPYRFSKNPVVTLLRYGLVQLFTFCFAFRYVFRKDTVFYINTLLPIGPALAGRLMRKCVVYHYHENAFIKGVFYKILCKGMESLASKIICVSSYQSSFLKKKDNIIVIPNALPRKFVDKLCPVPEEAYERKRVLMLGSLKLCKGILEFIELTKRLSQFYFELVINDTQKHIDEFWREYSIVNLPNLMVHSCQNDVTPFYNRASLVLNLSNKKKFLETFGLTALEALSAGLPVIVPTEGGITDIVEDGVNGFKIDIQELDMIEKKIKIILSDKDLYLNLSKNALLFSHKYNAEGVIEKISRVFQ